MGYFALIRQDGDAAATAALAARMADTARRRGFITPMERQAGGYLLQMAPKMVSPTPQLYESPNGDFVAVVGTFFYRGLYGQMALVKLLVDAQADAMDSNELRGNYTVILFVRGALTVFVDELGTYTAYKSADGRIWSNSLLAVASALDRLTLSAQGVYEYVFQGAVYGGDTLVKEIKILSPHVSYQLLSDMKERPRDVIPNLTLRAGTLQEHLDAVEPVLRDNFAAIVRAFNDNVDTALSGGYDSRLILALLRAQGVQPEVHVYGSPNDADVVVAKTIAKGEGIRLKHEDKSQLKPADADTIAAASQDQFWAFDGLPPDGVIGNGSDLATRRSRTTGGRLALNGGGGEVFRNFFYLPDRSFTVRDMVATFYSQYDPKTTTAAFDERRYLEALRDKIAAIFPDAPERLNRTEVEYIYPGFRGRFWTGRNTAFNTHLGPALTPFFEMNVVREALRVPLRFKNHGIFEAALIARIDPALARYPSAYGHDFTQAPSWKRRLKDHMTYLRPPSLRRLTFRLKNRLKPGRLAADVSPDVQAKLFPQGLPVASRFFNVPAINDSGQMNRLLTIEYFCQALNVDV